LRVIQRFLDLALVAQFALAGGAVMFVATISVGYFVSNRIEEVVVHNSAHSTALFMESFLSPLSQDLESSDELSSGAKRALEEILVNAALKERVMTFNIWKDGGLIVYSTDPAQVGQRLEMTPELNQAWRGEVVGSFEPVVHSDASGAAGENAAGPLLEIYSPIREVWSGRVVAVAEFYEVADDLARDLSDARRRSWLAVAMVMLAIGLSLYGVVRGGSRTIHAQRTRLTRQLDELRDLSQQNISLRRRVTDAAARASAMYDQAQRQVGADLHDGPAQLLGYAALRLHGLKIGLKTKEMKEDFDQIDRAVKDAMREIRSIARGLSLPEIESRTPADLIASAVEAHTARTGLPVALNGLDSFAPDLSAAQKICLYRFVQEGLTNAWKHARGHSVVLDARVAGRQMIVTISDEGPGFPEPQDDVAESGGMGLSGLRDRVESLGGVFEMQNRPGTPERPLGADLRMILDLESQA
jgi:signal transduction histidine kinase